MQIAANFIARENRKRISIFIDADTLGDFFDRGDFALEFHFELFPDYNQVIFRVLAAILKGISAIETS